MAESAREKRIQNELRVVARIIETQRVRLERGDVLNIQTTDGFLTVYQDDTSDIPKTVTLIDKFDFRVNLKVADLLKGKIV
ncbi:MULTISPECIES: hypothetical protein [Exiguobacterium]|uniref:hypothetical protein n=1 Tax=Exiguobacterium TaxID=33986 RepID=UPI00103A964D|nr:MULTISPECIES: hypothetical protein [Exiguobacterium]MCT4778344.1 hypothetical protein [Exiguobacterium aquaticum]MCT4789380.1 hypothetical protein [Exiguobacterium mexicanum]TCI20413.1 hypothetical protein EVJ34_14365 [Exiguobacterium sp. SL-9]